MPTHHNPAAVGECVHPGAAMSQARVGTHDNPQSGAPETEDILASILNAAAPTADQGPQMDEHPHNDESFAAFMASCWDRAPTTGPRTTWRRTTGSPPALRGILPPRPIRGIFTATMPP